MMKIFAVLVLMWAAAAAQAFVSGCWMTQSESARAFVYFSVDWPMNGRVELAESLTSTTKFGSIKDYMYSASESTMTFRQLMADFGGTTPSPTANFFRITGVSPSTMQLVHEEMKTYSLVRPSPQDQVPVWCERIEVTPAPTPSPTPPTTPNPTPEPTMRITLPPGETTVTTSGAESGATSATAAMSGANASTTDSADRNSVGTSSSAPDVGLIVGCVIGAVACLIAVALAVFLVAKRKHKRSDAQSVDDGVAMTTAPPGVTSVYGAAPRGAAYASPTAAPIVGQYKPTEMNNNNYVGMRQVAPSTNGHYQDMPTNNEGVVSTYVGMPASETETEYTTGQFEN
jgi:hypothetical protein